MESNIFQRIICIIWTWNYYIVFSPIQCTNKSSKANFDIICHRFAQSWHTYPLKMTGIINRQILRSLISTMFPAILWVNYLMPCQKTGCKISLMMLQVGLNVWKYRYFYSKSLSSDDVSILPSTRPIYLFWGPLGNNTTKF